MSHIDYARMTRVHPRQKAALTRAIKSGDPSKVLDVTRAAVREWNAIGAWPDDWHRWQVAVNDTLPWHQTMDIAELA